MTDDITQTPAPVPTTHLQGATVLIVDDSPLTRGFLREILCQAGARVEEAASGGEALRRSLELQPDVIVLDVELPDLRGPLVARRLKELERTSMIPILHLSAARTSSEDQALGLDVAADGYLVHPVDPTVFLSTVGAFVRIRRAADRMARLQAFTLAVASVDTPEAITALVLEEGARAAHADGVAVALIDDGELQMLGTSKGWPTALGAGPGRLSMVTPGPLNISVWAGEPVWLDSPRALAGDYPHLAGLLPPSLALACIPMAFGGRTRGAVAFFFSTSRTFSEAEQKFLTTLVAGCTLALERGHARKAERRAIAEQQRVEEALRASIRARNDLVAIVSHDLRGPLGTMAMGIEILRRWIKTGLPIDPAQLQKTADRLYLSNRRMTVLVDDLLDAASIESGHFTLERAPQPVRMIVGEVLELVESSAKEKSLVLLGEVEGDPVASCDRKRVVQILSNLVGNAIKFTPSTGLIRIRARADESQVTLDVADSGVGIADEQLPHLFDRYWSGHQREGAGTGLGLYIVRGLVEAHGGRVQVTSRIGQGTTFSFTLPLA